MKRLVLITGFLLLSVGTVSAQQIDLTNVDGLIGPGIIRVGQPVTFQFNWNNSGTKWIDGWTNGFRFWMVNGGARSAVDIDEAFYEAQAEEAGMDGGQFVNRF